MSDLLLQIKLGQLAALATAVCWTFSALCFEYSSKKIGSLSLNIIKMYLAFALFTVFAWIFRGRPFPTDASGFAWLWLGLSGIIGFVLGDFFLFKAFAKIGARTSMLIMSLVPPMTALIGFFLLSETQAYAAEDYGGIYSTYNAGQNWTQYYVHTSNWLLGIAILNNTNIWICGSPGGSFGTSGIWYSPDAGTTWQEQTPQILKDNFLLSTYKIRFIEVAE